MSKKKQRLARRIAQESGGTLSYSKALSMLQEYCDEGGDKIRVKAKDAATALPRVPQGFSPPPYNPQRWNHIPLGFYGENRPGEKKKGAGTLWRWDLTKDRALAISGAPGTGKSTAVNSIYEWISQGNGEKVKLMLMDSRDLKRLFSLDGYSTRYFTNSLENLLLRHAATGKRTLICLLNMDNDLLCSHRGFPLLGMDSMGELLNRFPGVSLLIEGDDLELPRMPWVSRTLLFQQGRKDPSRLPLAMGALEDRVELVDLLSNLPPGTCVNLPLNSGEEVPEESFPMALLYSNAHDLDEKMRTRFLNAAHYVDDAGK